MTGDTQRAIHVHCPQSLGDTQRAMTAPSPWVSSTQYLLYNHTFLFNLVYSCWRSYYDLQQGQLNLGHVSSTASVNSNTGHSYF